MWHRLMVLLRLVLRLRLHIRLMRCEVLLLLVLRARDLVLASLRWWHLLLLRLRLGRRQRVRSRSAKVGIGVSTLRKKLGEGVLLCELCRWGRSVLLLRRWRQWLVLRKMGRKLVLSQASQKIVRRLNSAVLLLLLSREVVCLLWLLLRPRDLAGREGTAGRPSMRMARDTSALSGSVHEVLQLLVLVLTRVHLARLLRLLLLLLGWQASGRLSLSKLCGEESRHLCLLLLRHVAVAVAVAMLGQTWHRRANAAVRGRRRQLVHVCRKNVVALRRGNACTPSRIRARTWLRRWRCKVTA